jgi:PAS domain S-box-containing protein
MMEDSPTRILIVDDSMIGTELIELLKEGEAGFEVQVDGGFPAGAENVESFAAVVAIVRAGDTMSLAEWTESVSSKTPVVICLSDENPQTAAALLRAGAQDCLALRSLTVSGLERSIHFSIERHAGHSMIMERLSIAKLRDSEALYHSLVESLTQNIIRKDLDGRFTFANSNFCKTVGMPVEKIVGKTDADLFTAPLAQKYQEDDRRVIATRTPFEIEEAHKTADGQTLVVKVVKTPVFDASGRVIGTQGIFWDITEQKRAATELAASRERFEIAVRGTADGIWDWDVITNEVYFSDRFKELLGYAPDGFGNDFGDWVSKLHPDDKDFTLEAVNDHVENRLPYDVEYRLMRKDGTYGWYRARGMAIWGATGKATRMAGSISDISARKRVEEALRARTLELERSNHDLEQFAYIASHDLKEPLRMVSSYVGLLERRYKDSLDDDAREFIQFAVDGVTRMKTLIEDLLVFSRVGTTGKELVETETADALRAALSNLDVAVCESGAAIKVEPDPLPRVVGDHVQLTQLFQNLVGNAIKFTEEGRTPIIEIAAGKHPTKSRYLRFTIQDDGIGIASSHTERIFEIFQRLHERAEYAGTGIGLAVARKIVERHGGVLSVESTVGEGSTFSFDLPAAE